MKWKRYYSLEDLTYASEYGGKMRKRQTSGNDVKILAEERWFKDGVVVNTIDTAEEHCSAPYAFRS
jgi:uncharacterized protein